jgi:hypothetical protein
MTGSTILQSADLGMLLAAIAGSPIVVPSASRPARHFADWCELQKPADIDAVILSWIASHVPARKPTALS